MLTAMPPRALGSAPEPLTVNCASKTRADARGGGGLSNNGSSASGGGAAPFGTGNKASGARRQARANPTNSNTSANDAASFNRTGGLRQPGSAARAGHGGPAHGQGAQANGSGSGQANGSRNGSRNDEDEDEDTDSDAVVRAIWGAVCELAALPQLMSDQDYSLTLR